MISAQLFALITSGRDHPVQPILLFGQRQPRLRHSHVTTKGRALGLFGKLAAVFCVVSENV